MLEKSLEIRSNPNTRQMIIGIKPYSLQVKSQDLTTEKQNTAYELLYSFFIENWILILLPY